MALIACIVVLFILGLLIPKSTALHEILRLPGYNFKAQTASRDNMQMERYSFGNHRRQYLHFFSPKDGIIKQDKIIIYYHGGGWTFGNPMMFRCNAQLFVDQGYAVIMPSYRRLPFYRCSDMREDARLALQKTISVLKDKGLADKKLVLSGLSAGGHLAALTAYDQEAWSSIELSRNKLSGILLFASPLDLSKMATTPVLWRLAGFRNSILFKTSNPVNYLQAGDNKPVFLLHGTKDGLVNYKSSLSFVEKRGTQSLKFHAMEDGTHLDSGNWIFKDGEIKAMVLKWLAELKS